MYVKSTRMEREACDENVPAKRADFFICRWYFIYLLDASDKYFIGSIGFSLRFYVSRIDMIRFFITKSFFLIP